MLAEVGPGAYALRVDVPEKMHDGRDLIAPLRIATISRCRAKIRIPLAWRLSPRIDDVVGVDQGRCGSIAPKDLLRFYEVTLSEGRGDVLLPWRSPMSTARSGRVNVDAILGDQFANVPRTRNPDQVTLLEEEKIAAYYGAGTLYATPARVESLL